MSFKRLAGLSFGALVVAGLGGAVTGCGSGTTTKQVEVSPEFTEKTQNMLKNMGPQMKQQKQAEAAAKKAAAVEGRKAP
jgi:Fe-S cluster biogenesis protein NfuA